MESAGCRKNMNSRIFTSSCSTTQREVAIHSLFREMTIVSLTSIVNHSIIAYRIINADYSIHENNGELEGRDRGLKKYWQGG